MISQVLIGSIDVVLSKPMTRWQVFLGKYAGSMVFVFVQACIFVLLTFVVIGIRWGCWIPGYLLTIPLVLLLFSYLYCVSVWVAVYFRSTVAAVKCLVIEPSETTVRGVLATPPARSAIP